MNNNIFYICQTLLEDQRMKKNIFQSRIIEPLIHLTNNVETLNICPHPRTIKNNYSDLLDTKKINLEKYSNNYLGNNNLFIGHYSTIIFQLISNSEKVLIIDLEWDELPPFIYDSCSLSIKWYDFISKLDKTLLSKINPSKPNKKFLEMFENKKNLRSIKSLNEILS